MVLFQEEETIGEIIIAVSEDNLGLLPGDLPHLSQKVSTFSKGGNTRQISVYNAIIETYGMLPLYSGA